MTHLNVSHETKEKLDAYVALILKWQRSVNLISPNTINDIWSRHIEDSLQLFGLVPDNAQNIYDLGSGGGLPALVLAITGVSKITMVESDRKKALFLKTVIRELSLENAHVINDRVENVEHNVADCITARAFAPLDKIISLAAPLAKENAVGLFPKGRDYQAEINLLGEKKAHVSGCIQSKTDSDAHIIKFLF